MAAPIPSDVKQVVAFIFLQLPDGRIVPNGTGFFVGVQHPTDKNRSFVYLVTAAHVLKDGKDGPFFREVLVRLNKKDGKTSELVKLPLITSGSNRNVFTHPDPTVDIAVIPALPDQSTIEFKMLPEEFLVTKDDFAKLNITEGSDVFFTGLFTGFLGENRNYPVVRFGKVALVTDEKVNWDGRRMELYLMETASYGGNSGSPVFFYLGSDRQPGSIIIGPPQLKLAGVMMGAFQDLQPVRTIQQNALQISASNMGIAAVVPSYFLQQILFGPELSQRRATAK